MKFVFVIVCILTATVCEARVFSFKNNWVAAYIRGMAGLTEAANDAYAESSGAATGFSDEVPYNVGGELGFMFLLGDQVTFRLGLEAFQTKGIKVEGKHTVTGVKLMDVESRVLVFNPTATVEYNFLFTENSKLFAFAGAGYSSVRLTNDYTLTAAGTAQYPGAKSGKESGEASVISSHLGLGYELYVFDNVTLAIDVGYRYLPVSKLEARADADPPSGSLSKGDDLVDNDGNARGIDMGGFFSGISFRFYIPPLH